MIEPLYWNPLPAAASWLAQRTGRAIDALTLVDIVASMGQSGDPAPTIIKAVLPRELKFAKLTMPALEDIGTGNAAHRFLSEMLHKQFGPLPGGMEYVGCVYPTVAPLPVNSLLDLLVHGTTKLAVLTGFETVAPHETVCLMPWGTSHHATIETCGINRSDLMELGSKLAEKYPQKAQAAPTAHAALPHFAETPEKRQAARYQACIEAGLNFSSNPLHPMPHGIGKVAESLGITRQTMTSDLVKHIERLREKSR